MHFDVSVIRNLNKVQLFKIFEKSFNNAVNFSYQKPKQTKEKNRLKTKARLHKPKWNKQKQKTIKNNRRPVYSNLILKSGLLGSVVRVKVSTLQAFFHFWNAWEMAFCWSDSDKSCSEYWTWYVKLVLDHEFTASYLLKRLLLPQRPGLHSAVSS